jgi:predicted metalloprotease with PDZ domain
MRPTVYLTSAAAAALAAAVLAVPSRAAAQDVYRIWRSGDDSTRAVLGVSLAPARGRADTLGARVSDVAEDGPAAKAGIEEGDRIVSIDGTALRVDPADADDPIFSDLASRRLQRALAKHKPGDEVTLGVRHDGATRSVRVKTVSAAQLDDTRDFGLLAGRAGGVGFSRALRNGRLSFDSLRARLEDRPALGLTVGATGNRRDTLGLFVSGVASDGPAEKAGIVEGARIAAIGDVDLRVSRDDAEDPEIAAIRARRFTRELEKKKPGDDVALRVWQNGSVRTVTVKAARAADVYKNRNGFAFSFGDGDGTFVMPRIAPLAPAAPLVTTPMVRVLPRTWMSAPVRPAVPRATYRTTTLPAPRARQIVDM